MIGTPPTYGGFGLWDGSWLLGISYGHNGSYQSGIAAAGSSSQATATQLPARVKLMEVDTCAANAGVALPPATKGVELRVSNHNTGQTLTVYPSIANNPVTGIQDTINNSTSTTVSTNTSKTFWCASDGVWAAQ